MLKPTQNLVTSSLKLLEVKVFETNQSFIWKISSFTAEFYIAVYSFLLMLFPKVRVNTEYTPVCPQSAFTHKAVCKYALTLRRKRKTSWDPKLLNNISSIIWEARAKFKIQIRVYSDAGLPIINEMSLYSVPPGSAKAKLYLRQSAAHNTHFLIKHLLRQTATEKRANTHRAHLLPKNATQCAIDLHTGYGYKNRPIYIEIHST
jgi:hypothetical protein